MDVEKHVASVHEDKRDMCSFCGEVKLERNKSGSRILPASLQHLIECVRRAKKEFKSMKRASSVTGASIERTTSSYEDSDVISTKFVSECRREKQVDSVVVSLQDDLKRALEERRFRFSGEAELQIRSENVEVEGLDVVRKFFDSSCFNIPEWLILLSERRSDRTIGNKLEYHPSYNIDTFWAKIYGLDDIEFYHVFVHMCIFDRFVAQFERNRDKFALLRYSCMCDKHDRVHVHFVMVAMKDAKAQLRFNSGIFNCIITEDRRRLSTLMKQEDMVISPSWPDHRHFFMKPIRNDLHLFNTLRYIGSRDSMLSDDSKKHSKCNTQTMYEIKNVSTDRQHEIQREVDALIKRYITNQNYAGSHFYIFRSLSHDAPMWFCAVSRNGMYSYVRYIMDKRSIMNELDKVITVNHISNCSLEFRHIMGHLSQYAIPLRLEDFLYHSSCQNKVISIGRRDLDRYIHLGRNEFMYLARGIVPCCNEYVKDIFFANQPNSTYKMTHKQSHEYEIYQKWTEETRKENETLKNQIDSLKLKLEYAENLHFSNEQRVKLMEEIGQLKNELDQSHKQVRKFEDEIRKLRHQVSYISLQICKRSGPYLESNDKSNV